MIRSDGVKKWKKLGGGSMHLPNRIIKPGEVFLAREEDIPKAFMDLLEEVKDEEVQPLVQKSVEVLEKESEAKKEETSETETEVASPEFEVKHKGGGKYIIVNPEGKQVNEQLLSKEEAQKLADELNAG